MSDLSWTDLELLGLDCESTGVSVERDRVVTLALIRVGPIRPDGSRREVTTHHWVINPGVEIPKGASDIHGWTTERVRAEGRPPAQVLDLANGEMALALSRGAVLVAMNAAFDFTIIDRDSVRADVEPLSARIEGPIGPVVDPFVIDKHLDPYRRGSRKLTALCQRYGVPLTEAHDAAADTMATLRLAWKLARIPHAEDRGGRPRCVTSGACRDVPLAEWEPWVLHEAQRGWKREQDASLGEYFRKQDAAAEARGEQPPVRDWPHGHWPLIPPAGR